MVPPGSAVFCERSTEFGITIVLFRGFEFFEKKEWVGCSLWQELPMYHAKGSSIYVVRLLRPYSVVIDFEVEKIPRPRN